MATTGELNSMTNPLPVEMTDIDPLAYARELKLNLNQLPTHVAFIMDGNRRWAIRKGQEKTIGHRAGVTTVKSLVKAFRTLEIPYMTIYAFSTENWLRPKTEVQFLMGLFDEVIQRECMELKEMGVRLHFIGRRHELAKNLQERMAWAEELTQDNQQLHLNIAFNYGGRAELVDATRQIASQVEQGRLRVEDIDEFVIQNYLYTANQPDPDLVIRTSGEMRISNYLLWQIAYAEIWITRTCWPEFQVTEFIQALCDYQNRVRRFGGV